MRFDIFLSERMVKVMTGFGFAESRLRGDSET